MSYNGLSESGKRVATAIELHYRGMYLNQMETKHPGFSAPNLSAEIEMSFEVLNADERTAVENFLKKPIGSGDGAIYNRLPWKEWLVSHLSKYPGDTPKLWEVERQFTNPNLQAIEWQINYDALCSQ